MAWERNRGKRRMGKKILVFVCIANHLDNYMLVAFKEYFITRFDVKIITNDQDDFIKSIDDTISNLSTFLNVVRYKKDKDASETIEDTLDILKEYTKDDASFNKLFNNYQSSHPILHCNIDDYLKLRNIYMEINQMDEEFNTIS
jgi:hypothetical protein